MARQPKKTPETAPETVEQTPPVEAPKDEQAAVVTQHGNGIFSIDN